MWKGSEVCVDPVQLELGSLRAADGEGLWGGAQE